MGDAGEEGTDSNWRRPWRPAPGIELVGPQVTQGPQGVTVLPEEQWPGHDVPWVRTPGAWLLLPPLPHPYIFLSLLPLGPLSQNPGMLHPNPKGSLTPWIFLVSDSLRAHAHAYMHVCTSVLTHTHTHTVLLVLTELKCIPRDICVHEYIDMTSYASSLYFRVTLVLRDSSQAPQLCLLG